MALNSLLSALPCPPIRLAHCLSTPLHHSALPCPAICALQRTAPSALQNENNEEPRADPNLQNPWCCRCWCRTRGPQAKQDLGHYDRDYFELRKCHHWATLYFKWGVGISGVNGITGCPNGMMLPNTDIMIKLWSIVILIFLWKHRAILEAMHKKIPEMLWDLKQKYLCCLSNCTQVIDAVQTVHTHID